MFSLFRFVFCVTVVSFSSSFYCIASNVDTQYIKVVNDRADKIVNKINFESDKIAFKASALISLQYQNLNDIYNWRDSIKKTKNVEQADLQKKVDSKLNKVHDRFIANLSAIMADTFVDKVKDGMTYGVVPLTYAAYQDMLPMLTSEQKTQIYAWLVEAREHAMDAESSEKKHAWFGKYKGRINNYLSAAGIDMRKEGEKWQARIKERNQASK